MLAALVAVWSLAFFGMAPEGEAAESFWLVARQIAPVMNENSNKKKPQQKAPRIIGGLFVAFFKKLIIVLLSCGLWNDA